MRSGGRKPVPTVLKKARGNPGKRSLPKNEPQPKIVCPSPPKGLDDIAKAEWKRAAKILHDVRVLTDADLAVFRGYCVSYARMIEAEALVTEEGVTIEEARGGVSPYTITKEIPAFAAEVKARKQMTDLARELGLSPSSRARVATIPETEIDPFAEFDGPKLVKR